MDKEYYYKKLYPFQDGVLDCIRQLETGFYLSGGTAASRMYLGHRSMIWICLSTTGRSLRFGWTGFSMR